MPRTFLFMEITVTSIRYFPEILENDGCIGAPEADTESVRVMVLPLPIGRSTTLYCATRVFGGSVGASSNSVTTPGFFAIPTDSMSFREGRVPSFTGVPAEAGSAVFGEDFGNVGVVGGATGFAIVVVVVSFSSSSEPPPPSPSPDDAPVIETLLELTAVNALPPVVSVNRNTY